MKIQNPTITQITELKGDGANLTGSFSGALDASSFASTGTGLVSGSAQTIAHLPSGTVSGSAQTVANLPSGTVSGSAQTIANLPSGTVSGSVTSGAQGTLTINGNDIDLGVQTADNVEFANVTVSGNLTVTGTTTTVDSTTLDIGDNIISLNGTAATKGGLAVNDDTGTTNSGSLLWDGSNDYWVAGPTGSEQKIFTAGATGDGLVSGSSIASSAQGEVTLTTNGVAATAVDLGLQTTDDVQFDSFGVGTAASGTTGEIRATNDITAFYSSDERLKENIADLEGALDKVKAMRGVTFDWKELSDEERKTIHSHEGHDLGVIAQEVQAVYPELVHQRDHGYLSVDYVKLTAVLISAVKELSDKVDELSK
jgi:hypothetical protein